MNKAVKICSALCGITAAMALIFGIRVLTGHGFFIGLRIFSLAEKGTFMGFIGNLLGIAATFLSFGIMALCGFKDTHSARRSGFICGIVMTVLCVISVIMSVAGGKFTFGDILITALPAAYTYSIFKSA